jgi:hypothetical protein
MGFLSGVTCVLWCDHALARGESQGADRRDSRVARMPTEARPTSKLAETPISAMRPREDGPPKWEIGWTELAPSSLDRSTGVYW